MKRLLAATAMAATAAFAADWHLHNTARASTAVARGAYLTTIMDCSGCHTPGAMLGKPDAARPLAGSEVGFRLPGLGTFYPPNLTPDPETGLGSWAHADIIKAIRTGVRPDGRVLAPIMPWHNYSKLTDEDAAAIAAYIKSITPIRNSVHGPAGDSEAPKGPYMAVVSPK